MKRYSDSDHAFLVGTLFVLMLVWLFAFVCICLSVSVQARLCLTVLLSVCVRQCHAAKACVCFSVFVWAVSVRVPRTPCVSCLLCLLSVPWRHVVVLCWLGLPCPISPWFVLSCVVLSVCHLSVLSLCCVYSSFLSPSFVCPLVIPFVLLCSFIRPKRLMLKIFSRERK